MLPALFALNPSILTGGKPLHEFKPKDRLFRILVAIHDADNETWHDVIHNAHELKTFTDDELQTLADHINEKGLKQLVFWFLNEHPGYITPENVYRNATMQWWTKRWEIPGFPKFNFAKQSDGSVIVDLWHTRRGNRGPESFRSFKSEHPTFFFGSKGEVYDHLDSLQDYVEETEDGEDNRLYVKRGRFQLKPLLWFDDNNVVDLRSDMLKANVVAKLVNSHPHFEDITFDLMKEDDQVWKKSLYYQTENLAGKRFATALRLDNNCVDDAKTPLLDGFNGTLAVDVSGFSGAALAPGSTRPESKSVVVWDVPGSLLSEDPWKVLII